MRITRTYLCSRWTHRPKEDLKLEVFVVGTEDELHQLVKLIESKCAESDLKI